MVLDTDYDNWAVVYGCDTYYLFFHGYYATLLSREPFADYPYVRAAKDALDIINYDYGNNWVKTGIKCGFDAAKTLDEVMIDIFETPPDWNVYNMDRKGTYEAYKLYYGGNDMPYGFITGPLTQSFWEWITVTIPPPGCYEYRDQWWEGTEPTLGEMYGGECDKEVCIACNGQPTYEDQYVNTVLNIETPIRD